MVRETHMREDNRKHTMGPKPLWNSTLQIHTVFKCVPISTVQFTINCCSKYTLIISWIIVKLIYSFFYCNFYIGLFKAIKRKPYSEIAVENGTQLKTVYIYSTLVLLCRSIYVRSRLYLDNQNSITMECCNNISLVVEFQRWWVLKSKIFAQESSCSKEILILTTLNYLWSWVATKNQSF